MKKLDEENPNHYIRY
jgi:propionyl-CoA synthetase